MLQLTQHVNHGLPRHHRDMEWLRGQVSLRESFIGSYNVNVACTHVVTYSFLPLFLKFPLTVDLQRGWPKTEVDSETVGYRCSKAALNMLMLDYHFRLQPDGVKVWAVLPGFWATYLGHGKEMVMQRQPGKGGELMRKIVEGESDEQVGRLIDKDGVCES